MLQLFPLIHTFFCILSCFIEKGSTLVLVFEALHMSLKNVRNLGKGLGT